MNGMATTRRGLLALGGGGLVLARGGAARAEDWPRRPIRLVVAFAPGGATDVQGRILAERLSAELGQAVVVENRPGASGIIGTEAVARAAPDGYTLLLGSVTTHAVNVPLYGTRLPYDPVRDFVAVSRTNTGYNLLAIHPSVPARSVPELIALAKAKPGALAYGSGGNGTSTHLAGELFRMMAGVDILHVPFRSTAPATTALTAGQIQMMFDTSVSAMPLMRDGQVRVLATTAPQRQPALPELPTVAETLPGFTMDTWSGLYAPAGTPRPIVDRIDAATRAALAQPDLLRRFADLGAIAFPAGPEEFAAFQAAEIARWTKVVRDAGITAE
ncbi:tripartite tricarboxylate transporter substrate binding protein [Roseomonas sp. OT10]|uniref:Bug family tripartite tricarboxylate transporter substrate binding protein n=1 Tax=Roseomonas cutis TaxID=2897332 RepID=UPI001E5D0D4E|nr:tripartite tricarboxylate transporter substrate binding protein [Roseomonas sp. OT10]UFN49296.1 tripartite tricarboxylate transporter substrate binding protein [Roseomonas sp. OT10]